MRIVRSDSCSSIGGRRADWIVLSRERGLLSSSSVEGRVDVREARRSVEPQSGSSGTRVGRRRAARELLRVGCGLLTRWRDAHTGTGTGNRAIGALQTRLCAGNRCTCDRLRLQVVLRDGDSDGGVKSDAGQTRCYRR